MTLINTLSGKEDILSRFIYKSRDRFLSLCCICSSLSLILIQDACKIIASLLTHPLKTNIHTCLFHFCNFAVLHQIERKQNRKYDILILDSYRSYQLDKTLRYFKFCALCFSRLYSDLIYSRLVGNPQQMLSLLPSHVFLRRQFSAKSVDIL